MRFFAVLISGLLIWGLELGVLLGMDLNLPLRIALGFLILFFLPGYWLAEIFLKKEVDWLDQLGFAFLFSLGIFSYPALLVFVLEFSLSAIFGIFCFISLSLWLILLFQTRTDIFLVSFSYFSVKKVFSHQSLVIILALLGAALSFYAGAFRRPVHDWDYYNYITMVRKFLFWGKASIANYYYLDAPPDPIHSYNLLALLWALVAKNNRIDPVPLYLHSAFLTVPLCFIAFYGMVRRMLGRQAGLFAFVFYFFFQLFYGGLFFVRTSNLFPDDGMWLLAFPALVNLSLLYLEKKKAGLIPLIAFSALGVSIVHPLWGLAFYLVHLYLLTLDTFFISKIIPNFVKKGKFLRGVKYLLVSLVLAPYFISALYMIVKIQESPRKWFEPIFPGFFLDRLWFYVLIFVIVPFFLLLFLARPLSRLWANFKGSLFYQNGYPKRLLFLILVCLFLASPYIYLRAQTVQYTQWSSFGRNPYRGLVTPNLYLLNPFKRSFSDPNISFYPFFWLGLVFSPWLYWYGKKRQNWSALTGFYAFSATVALVLHPVLATVFAKFFSLGYLRRILRLAGLMAFLPPAVFLERIFSGSKWRAFWQDLAGVLVACGIVLILLPIPGDILSRGLFQELLFDLKPENRQTLFWDDTPFKFLQENKLIKPGEVIYSDIFTSFRATAYLDVYVVVQHKPGVGVPDQDLRRLEEMVFFAPESGTEVMLQILRKRKANWVIINRDPNYFLPAYNLSCAHPEAIAKLNGLSPVLEKIYDQGDWVIFRVK